MSRLLNAIIRRSSLHILLRYWENYNKNKADIFKWNKKGRPSPPPHIIKQRTLISYANKYDLEILVETGTFYGTMVEAMRSSFKKIYSIELSEALFKKAQKRFDGVQNVTLIQGDSGVELGKLTAIINKPTLFWLDGHYSEGVTARGDKDTPIYEELTHIFNTNIEKYVIIIDDARCFDSDPNYPSINELSEFIKTYKPDADIEVNNDSIRIT